MNLEHWLAEIECRKATENELARRLMGVNKMTNGKYDELKHCKCNGYPAVKPFGDDFVVACLACGNQTRLFGMITAARSNWNEECWKKGKNKNDGLEQ